MAIEMRPNAPEHPVKEAKKRNDDRVERWKKDPVISNALREPPIDIQAEMRKAAESIIIQKHQERLAYNAAYQRDLRTIKRLGLSVTVSEYRKSLVNAEV